MYLGEERNESLETVKKRWGLGAYNGEKGKRSIKNNRSFYSWKLWNNWLVENRASTQWACTVICSSLPAPHPSSFQGHPPDPPMASIHTGDQGVYVNCEDFNLHKALVLLYLHVCDIISKFYTFIYYKNKWSHSFSFAINHISRYILSLFY